MSAIATALTRASGGLDWSYPCLIWIADYLRDATGSDPAAAWRQIAWDKRTAGFELARLGRDQPGQTAVERALCAIAARDGWELADGLRQGAVMIGVFVSEDGVGVPAIFDGQRRWIVSNDGRGWSSIEALPVRMWEVQREAA